MTEFAVVHTDLPDSEKAGYALGLQIREAMLSVPDVVIVFAAPLYDHTRLLHALRGSCRSEMIVGCSSAGEFTTDIQGEGLACALAISSRDMAFNICLGRSLSNDRAAAVAQVVSSFQGMSDSHYRYRTALVLADEHAGMTELLVEQLALQTKGTYQFFGGGAGDNVEFIHTSVFYNEEVICDAMVALEILSNKPLGIGVRHGWQPLGEAMRVTAAEGTRLISLNNKPAITAFAEHAIKTRQELDLANPMAFFLHNMVGIGVDAGYKLRMPMNVNDDGSLVCAAEIPLDSTINIMSVTQTSTIEAARQATQVAMQKLYGCKPGVALFFDCIATRLRMGQAFGQELAAIRNTLGHARYVGCNSHGQLARAQGQFGGFHTCTAVVCVFPE
jgi:hypothetical protein